MKEPDKTMLGRDTLRSIAQRMRGISHDWLPFLSPIDSSDVFLASFPKSGNTYLRFLWANLERVANGHDEPLNFKLLDELYLTVYETGKFCTERWVTLPRSIKTHFPRHWVPTRNRRSVMVWRHPGDAMCSYFAYLGRYRNNPIAGLNFSEFLRDERYGIPAWISFMSSWAGHATVEISYQDLYARPEETMTAILGRLEIPVPGEDLLCKAVEFSSIRTVRMLENEATLSADISGQLVPGASFVRRGDPSEWKEQFSGDDQNYALRRLEANGMLQYWNDQ